MNVDFNKQQFQQMMDRAYQFGSNRPSGMTQDEYCQQYIIDHLPNISQSEAQEIIAKIKIGIDTFNRGIDTFATEDGFNHQAAITSLIKGKSQQECFDILVNILLVARVSKIDPSELNTLTDEQLKSLREQIISGREIADDTIAVLQQEAINAMEEMNILGANVPESIENATGDITELRKFLADSDNTLYTAVLTYIDSRNGKIHELSESTPENIGMTVAAGIQEAKVTTQLQDNIIDLPTWAKWIKIIGGVLLWGTLLLGGIFLALFGVMPLCMLIFNWLGAGTFATIIALAVALYGSFEVSEFIQKYLIEPTINKAGELYDKLIQWIEKKRKDNPATMETVQNLETSATNIMETESGTNVQPQVVLE